MISILFIINPVIAQYKFEEHKIRSYFDVNYLLRFEYTKEKNDAYNIAKKHVEDKIDIIVAVGGDGTVNQVVRAAQYSSTKVGLLVSTTTLASNLNIPKNLKRAVELIKKDNFREIDLLEIITDDKKYLAASFFGVGFSAQIVHHVTLRKHFSYYLSWMIAVYTLLFKYRKKDQKKVHLKFLYFDKVFAPYEILVGNGNKIAGNNNILRRAVIDDGMFDVALVYRNTLLRGVWFFFLNLFPFIRDEIGDISEFYKAEELNIEFYEPTRVQIDYKPYVFDGKVQVKIRRKAVKVLCAQ